MYPKQTNREHKDRLIRFIFSNKTNLLSLYNAINHSNYTNEEHILLANRSEVTDMLLTEYDEAFHIACEKKISYEEGRAEAQADLEKAHLETAAAQKQAKEAQEQAKEAQEQAKEAQEQNEQYEKRIAELELRLQFLNSSNNK